MVARSFCAVACVCVARAAFAQCDYRSIVLSDNPVAYWRLSETGPIAVDQVSGTHSGQYVGSILRNEPGALSDDPDGSAQFDGSSAWVAVPNAPDLDFTSRPFSLEAWIRKSAPFGDCAGGCIRRVIDKVQAGTANGFGLDLNDWSIRTIGSCNTGAGCGQASGIPYDTLVGVWYHVVTVSTGTGTATTFVNGMPIGTDDYVNANPWLGELRIGADSLGGSRFVGWIDEAAVYDHALTHQQVANHFFAGRNSLGFFSQPAGAEACPSANTTFNAGAAGAGQLQFRWQRLRGSEWIDLVEGDNSTENGNGGTFTATGTDTASLAVGGWVDAPEDVPLALEHQFRCVVTNTCGSAESNPATLTLCPPDFDCDGFISGADFDQFVQAFEDGNLHADYDGDGFITGLDFDLYVQAFEAGC